MGLARLRNWILTGCVLLAALVVTPAIAQQRTVLRVAYTADIDSINPFQATSLQGTQIGRLMYEFLTVNGADDFSPQPGLAERWESAPDNLTWTFHIRKGMQWSDGQPITAKDVAFTYNKIMTDADAADANGVAVTNYESVAATDDSTVVIRTKQPQASLLQSEIPIVPEHIWKAVTDYRRFTNTDRLPVVGSGPFVLTGYREGQSITLEANDKFWRGRPKIDTLQFVKYESTDAVVQGLRKGDVDLVYRITAAQYKALREVPNVKTNVGNSHRFVEIILNPSNPKKDGSTFGNGNPALKDVAFRTALAYAVDVKTIIDKVKQGLAEPATQIIPPAFPDWTFHPSKDLQRGFDLAKANELLTEAGYARGVNGKRTDKQGREINLRLLAPGDNVDDQQIAEYFKGWFQEIGLGLTTEFKATNQLDEDVSIGNFDLAFSGWSVSPDPDFMLAQETCDTVGTDLADSNFCDVGYDRLYHEQQTELDRHKRMTLVQRAQSILYENVSALMLTYDKQLEAYRSDRFSSFQTQPADSGIITNQSGYWGYYSAIPVGAQKPAENTPGLAIGAVAGGVIVVVGLWWAVNRRRRSASDKRE